MKDFRDLKVWEISHALTITIYSATKEFPKYELYGIVSQMRRSSSSIPTNIAEGCGMNSDPSFARYLSIAFGSASELEYLILLSYELGYLDGKTFKQLGKSIEDVKKMLSALLKKVRT